MQDFTDVAIQFDNCNCRIEFLWNLLKKGWFYRELIARNTYHQHKPKKRDVSHIFRHQPICKRWISLSIAVFYILGKLDIKMATKVYLSRHQYPQEKISKLIALSYYFPETTLVRSYTTEILISHCFYITTDSSNTNADGFSQVWFRDIWIPGD